MAATTMQLRDLLDRYVPGSHDQPWTWDDERTDLLTHPCPGMTHDGQPCSDPDPGCYQRQLEAHLTSVGHVTHPVLLGPDGRVWDGHHHLVAARHLGFAHVPIETA